MRNFISLVVAAALVLLLQPVYFFAMANLDNIISKERTWLHIKSAFDSGVLVDASHRNQIIASGDRFTDCYALGEGMQPNVGPLEEGIMAPRPASERHACDDLKQAAVDPNSVNWQRYARYWHGYRIYSAPLASLIPILLLKLVNLAVLASVAALFVVQSDRLIGTRATIWLCAPVVLLSDFVRIWHVTPHTVSTVVIVGGAGIFARMIHSGSSDRALIVSAAAFGSVFNFVDFLVNPPWMPMLLAFFLLAAGRRSGFALLVVLAWFAGYAATWSAKWLSAYFVDPSFDILSDVLGAATFRIAGDFVKVSHYPLAATTKVFLNAFLSWGVILFVPALIFLGVKLTPRLATAWPALIPIVWFEILSNHSQIHDLFVSRSAAAAIGVCLASAQMARMLDNPQQFVGDDSWLKQSEGRARASLSHTRERLS
ncbi:hypothetical protein GA0061099_103910 [Bradyrhizobium yuanmingense]|uniref:Uncharacterized protein n=1 Tax=Bradyrhizobium yuanmingense TaxID=108015 RepID=A0A1C3XKE3_9BRAD|nr:hypothetical protein [Bradyrhizobium yuanmingense]TWI18999.1 hypothetical protein IQ15_07025 [Bradyrhizobium yuanmingense]SCB52733.1 hypothetical protein GA0061099_103910 [Bradyrhizobium yuanmingense]